MHQVFAFKYAFTIVMSLIIVTPYSLKINRVPHYAHSFELDDILSEEDMKTVQQRFQIIQEIFPTVQQEEMEKVVTKYPLLLAM